ARLEAGLAEFGRVRRVGAMLTLFMTDRGIRNFDDVQTCDTERYGALFRHLLAHGIYVAPSQFEAMFLSLAHSDDDIDRTAETAGDSFRGACKRGADRARPRRRVVALGGRARRGRGTRAGVLAARRGALRVGPRDDLRGLPRALRLATPVRTARSRQRTPARRLPLRPRARAHRGFRQRRRRRRPVRADLALLAAPGGERR